MRILSVDWGNKRTGLAICDELAMTVRPLTTLKGLTLSNLIQQICKYAIEYEAVLVIVGLPLKNDGSMGDAASRILKFVELLQEHLYCPVETWNERLTSYMAEELIKEYKLNHKLSNKKQKTAIDQIAAAILLEDYLSSSKFLSRV